VSDEPSEPAGRTTSPSGTRSVRPQLPPRAVGLTRLRGGARLHVAAAAVALVAGVAVAVGAVATGKIPADPAAAADRDVPAASAAAEADPPDTGQHAADRSDAGDRLVHPSAPDAGDVVTRGGMRPALPDGDGPRDDRDGSRSAATRGGAPAERSRGGASSSALPPDRRGAEAGVSGSASVAAPADPRDIARAMLARHGWSSSEFGCLDALWVGESNWDPRAENPTSGAYGIPQSLPAEKMAAAGPDWRTNPATQIEWGLSYIASVYGSPCAANSFKMGNGWY